VFLTMNPKMVSQIQIWLAESNINWKAWIQQWLVEYELILKPKLKKGNDCLFF
jgi:hypothetical protein